MPDPVFPPGVMHVVVDAPINRPPRGATLLRSANPVGETDARWEAGLLYRPNACGSSDIAQATGLCGGTFVAPEPTDRPDDVGYVPPFVTVGQACSAISGVEELNRTRERALLLLEQCQTLGIARELWRGDVASSTTPDLPNDWLTKDPDVLNSGASTAAIDALAWLEAELALCGCGGIGMIHAAPYTVTVWKALRLIDREPDGRLFTALGTLVVGDPGYDGSSPDNVVDASNATAWAYATGMVDVRLGATQTVGDPRTIDRSNNDFTVYAYRAFAATFDPCCHLGIKVNHTART